jgi:type III restriction enzyme
LRVPHLHQTIATKVAEWRRNGFAVDEFDAIAEILDFQVVASESGARENRFLRTPQIEALQTYWWLRLVAETPHVVDLYRQCFSQNTALLESLGLQSAAISSFVLDNGIDALFEKVRDDADFVAEHKLEALRETLTLEYPSYILALAMGAGKTALMGAIIATEFAMALEYPDGPFVQNALVFAPGTTILGSLRELASLPYDRILPPRLFKHFAATVKLIFTRDGDPDIPVIRGDSFNVIVTNTEKIRITKETIRKGDIKGLFSAKKEDEARSEIANRRLQAIASLPHLAVFSDEAHHTFGRTMENDLKRVRQTIDYLHHNSPNLIAVINTTGTPYLHRQPLRDVVCWYGLSAGIRDDILKSVAGQIHGYSFDAESTDDFLAAILDDFFAKYRDVALPNGAPAKLAIYFPQVEDLRELRPIIEAKLQVLGVSTDAVLENTNQARKAEIDAFDRLNDPRAPHRIILLVNKGTEGWNCPSLFACALARKLRTSNNFVLQAASRCLRQVPGNPHRASIYLSMDNRRTLDKELQETYGESIQELQRASTQSRTATIRLRKLNLPPLVVKQIVHRVERTDGDARPLAFEKPTAGNGELVRRTFDLSASVTGRSVLAEHGAAQVIETAAETIDVYSAATKLAAVYRFDVWALKAQLASLYPNCELPQAHLAPLAEQLEAHTSHYVVKEEEVEVALALVKPEGFEREVGADGTEIYTAEISYPIARESLLTHFEKFVEKNPNGFGFHYSPYNFDSKPEAEFFERMLDQLKLQPDDIEDIYFTGAFCSPNKTDFLIEYRDVDGHWRSYTPDFIIRKKPVGRRKWGKCLIVEIKAANHRAETEADFERHSRGEPAATKEGRKAIALHKWKDLSPDRLKYEILYVSEAVPSEEFDKARNALNTVDQ